MIMKGRQIMTMTMTMRASAFPDGDAEMDEHKEDQVAPVDAEIDADADTDGHKEDQVAPVEAPSSPPRPTGGDSSAGGGVWRSRSVQAKRAQDSPAKAPQDYRAEHPERGPGGPRARRGGWDMVDHGFEMFH